MRTEILCRLTVILVLVVPMFFGSGCLTMGLWAWGFTTENRGGEFEAEVKGSVQDPELVILQIRGAEGYPDGAHALQIPEDWRHKDVERLQSFYRLDSLLTPELKPYAAGVPLHPMPWPTLDESCRNSDAGGQGTAYVLQSIRSPSRPSSLFQLWAYSREKGDYFHILNLEFEPKPSSGSPFFVQAIGVDRRAGQPDRIVMQLRGVENREPGLYSFEVPCDIAERAKHVLANTARLVSLSSLEARPVTRENFPEIRRLTYMSISDFLDGRRPIHNALFFNRVYSGTDYRKTYEIWGFDADRNLYICLGISTWCVEEWLVRWYGPPVAVFATPVFFVADILLLPAQPYLIQYMAMAHD